MREMLLGDIYTQSSDIIDADWRELFNVVNPRWTDIPLISDSEMTTLRAAAASGEP